MCWNGKRKGLQLTGSSVMIFAPFRRDLISKRSHFPLLCHFRHSCACGEGIVFIFWVGGGQTCSASFLFHLRPLGKHSRDSFVCRDPGCHGDQPSPHLNLPELLSMLMKCRTRARAMAIIWLHETLFLSMIRGQPLYPVAFTM